MAEKGSPEPTPKAIRAKNANQTKTKEPSLKNPPKQNPSKTAPPLEPRVVVVPVVPIDQSEDQGQLYPPNQPNQLPDTPPYQPPNNLPNQPSPPPNQPQNPQPNAPMQPPNPPDNPPNLVQPQIPQLSWSYFKPEVSGKPEEDVIANLLRKNDWMETHNFPEEAQIQRFCLTLTDEAILWYETLRHKEADWTGLLEHFRQQYSKFSNTREQLFHVKRSFQYDESSDTIDTYIGKIKQAAALLNYGKPQILELFINTLPSKLYWILFPINNLRDVVDATNRVLTKEKLDKQLSGQATTSTPFMKVGDVSNGKRVSFNVQDSIGEQLENLTLMVYNMSMQKNEGKKPFKPHLYPKKSKGTEKTKF